MPLLLRPITSRDTLAWIRIRSLAYRGPTHDVLHGGRPIAESSIRAAAEDRKRDLLKPNTFHWKVVDSDLSPSEDDPPDNCGRTIAISAWSLCNVHVAGGDGKRDDKPTYAPPELRMDAIASLFGPLHAAQQDIMGTDSPYLMLSSLATHPLHQGRGAASMMLEWGLDEADRRGFAVYLDGTGIAKPLYERNGFGVVKEVEWDRKPWGGDGKDRHYCMVRKAKLRENGEGQ